MTIMNAHSLSILDSDKEFDDVYQQLILVIKIKEGRPFKIMALIKSREAIKSSGIEMK